MNLCYSHWFVVICENLVKVGLNWRKDGEVSKFVVGITEPWKMCRSSAGHLVRKRRIEKILSAYGNGNHTQMNMKSIWDGLFWIFMNISEIISHHFAEKIWWKDTSREMRMMEHDSFFRCGPCVGWIFSSEASRNGNWPWGAAPGWRIICGVKLCVIMCSSIMVMICQYITVYFRISEWWWFIILSKA